MKYWYIYLLFLLMPVSVKANTDCDGTKLAELAAKAGLIKYQYQYSNPKIALSAYNVDSSIYFKIGNKIINTNNGNASFGLYNQGETVLIEVYTSVKLGCEQSSLLTKKYEVLPYYNIYANDERCKSYSNLAVCNQFYEQPITKEVFEESIRLYEEDIQNKPVKVTEVVEKEMPWYQEYQLYLIIAGWVLVTGLIIITSIIIMQRYRDRSTI